MGAGKSKIGSNKIDLESLCPSKNQWDD